MSIIVLLAFAGLPIQYVIIKNPLFLLDERFAHQYLPVSLGVVLKA
jgi:hypothetical protein